MKKVSVFLLILSVVLALAIIVLGIKYFVLTDHGNVDKPVTKPTVAPQTEKTSAQQTDAPEVLQSIEEGVEIITTNLPEAEVIDLTGEESTNVRIETTSPLEYKTPAEAYDRYSPVSVLGIKNPVWAYQDAEGNVCLRVYGTRWKKINNVNQEELEGYFDATIKKLSDGKTTLEVLSVTPVDQSAEIYANPVRKSPDELTLDEEKYHLLSDNLYACVTKTGARFYRTFAEVNGKTGLYDCDENGVIKQGSIPVAVDEEVYNLLPYNDEPAAGNAIVNYPGRYPQAGIVLTIEP